MKKNMFPDKKSKGKYFLLSIVALVEILVLLAVSTYAWVETVSTIRIYTSDSAVAKVDANPTGQLLTHNFQKATFSSTAATPIDLSQMYHESGAFHLAPASSADGKTIYFPHYQPDGSVNDYRKADSSDNMVNYVSFSFRVAAANYYVFDADPTISFGGTAVGSNSSNSTLVRLSLQVGEGTPAIYSKDTSTTAVVNAIGGGTGATNVRAFSSYTGGNGNYALHTTSANQIVTFRLWIQDPTHASSTAYTGKQLSITNLKLVPAYPVTTYVTVNRTAASSSSPAGTVQSGSASASYTSTAYVKHGSSVTLKATNSNSSTYTFKGWGTAASSTSYENTNLSYSKTNVTSAITRYAHFTTKISITAKAVTGTTSTTASNAGNVEVNTSYVNPTSGTNSDSYNFDYGSTIYMRASANSGYTFIGWYNSSGTRLTTSTDCSPGTATAAATYYARFMANPTITAKAVLGSGTSASATYGTVRVGSSGSYAATSSATVSYNGSVTLYAQAASGYAIDCWYSGTPSGSTYVANSNGLSSITVPSVTSDKTYYCSFKKKTVVTLYFTLTSSEDNMKVYAWEDQFGHKLLGDWPGSTPTFDKSTGLYSISFETVDTGTFHVQINSDNTHTYNGTLTDGNTYLLDNGTWSENPTLSGNRYFYYTNSNNWSGTIKCHHWKNGGSGTTWPGDTMTWIYKNSSNQDVYQVKVTTAHDRLIFNNNNGGNQTGDITVSNSQCRYYGNIGTW